MLFSLRRLKITNPTPITIMTTTIVMIVLSKEKKVMQLGTGAFGLSVRCSSQAAYADFKKDAIVILIAIIVSCRIFTFDTYWICMP